MSRDSLLQKSKRQKTAAWILVSGGAAMTIVGTALEANQFGDELFSLFDSKNYSHSSAGAILIAGGLATMAGSIPLFIASHRNANKAVYLRAAINEINIPVKKSPVLCRQAAVTITIPLGSK